MAAKMRESEGAGNAGEEGAGEVRKVRGFGTATATGPGLVRGWEAARPSRSCLVTACLVRRCLVTRPSSAASFWDTWESGGQGHGASSSAQTADSMAGM